MSEMDDTLGRLDDYAASRIKPGLALRVLARARKPEGTAWGVPAIVAAAACCLAFGLLLFSQSGLTPRGDDVAQWSELVASAQELDGGS